MKQNNAATSKTAEGEPISAQVVAEADGAVTAKLSASANAAQSVTASENSAIAGSSVLFPPGALGIDTEVTIEEGVTLATLSNSTQLGISTDANIKAASATLVIGSSLDIEAAQPFTIAINLSGGAALALQDTSKRMYVIYQIKKQGIAGSFIGVIPDSQVTVNGNSVSVTTTYFGAYQVIFADIEIPKVEEIKTETVVATVRSEPIPPEPTGVTAVSPNFDAIVLSWQSGGGTTDSFVVASQMTNEPDTKCRNGTIATVEPGVLTYKLAADPGKTYLIRVCAVAKSGARSDGIVIKHATKQKSSTLVNTALTPTPGATNQDLAQQVEITFNESFVVNGGLKLFTAAGATVTGTVLKTANSLRFTPHDILDPNTTYEAIVSGIVDDKGIMFPEKKWTFTTRSLNWNANATKIGAAAVGYKEAYKLPVSVASSDGKTGWLAWSERDDTNQKVRFKVVSISDTGPGTPVTLQVIETGGNPTFVYDASISINQQNVVALIWTVGMTDSGNKQRVYGAIYKPTSGWSSAQILRDMSYSESIIEWPYPSPLATPTVKVLPNGSALAYWSNNIDTSNRNNESIIYDGTNWGSVVTVMALGAVSPDTVRSCFNAAGNGLLIVGTSGSPKTLFVARFNGSTWSSKETLSADLYSDYSINCSINDANKIVVIWEYSFEGINELKASVASELTGTFTTTTLDDPGAGYFSSNIISTAKDGSFTATWNYIDNTEYSIKSARLAGTWSDTTVIDTSSSGGSFLEIIPNSSNNMLVWFPSGGISGSVKYATQTATTQNVVSWSGSTEIASTYSNIGSLRRYNRANGGADILFYDYGWVEGSQVNRLRVISVSASGTVVIRNVPYTGSDTTIRPGGVFSDIKGRITALWSQETLQYNNLFIPQYQQFK